MSRHETNGFDPTYENLQDLSAREKKARGKSDKFTVNELLGLDKTNDPFYVGSPTEVAMAKWLKGIWEEKGYTSGKHIRRIHYEISTESHKQYYRHDGAPYVHNPTCLAYLEKAARYARHLGLIPVEDFSDMRVKDSDFRDFGGFNERSRFFGPSKEPSFEANGHAQLRWAEPYIGMGDASPEYDLPSYEPTGYEYYSNDQPYRLEAWFEKEVGTEALIPVCDRYNVHLLVGLGNFSMTQADLFLRRAIEDGRPVRILYFSDWDAPGHQMPVSVARQIEYRIHTKYRDTHDIALVKVAVTPEQINGDNPRGDPATSQTRLPEVPRP